MDNNLINIDELFRQRLGGGEEQEREGSWSRMKALLEDDTRKKPMGLLNWKRALTYISALVLIASVSLGGYEYSAYRNAIASTGTSGSAVLLASGNTAKEATTTQSLIAVDNKSAATVTSAKNINAEQTDNGLKVTNVSNVETTPANKKLTTVKAANTGDNNKATNNNNTSINSNKITDDNNGAIATTNNTAVSRGVTATALTASANNAPVAKDNEASNIVKHKKNSSSTKLSSASKSTLKKADNTAMTTSTSGKTPDNGNGSTTVTDQPAAGAIVSAQPAKVTPADKTVADPKKAAVAKTGKHNNKTGNTATSKIALSASPSATASNTNKVAKVTGNKPAKKAAAKSASEGIASIRVKNEKQVKPGISHMLAAATTAHKINIPAHTIPKANKTANTASGIAGTNVKKKVTSAPSAKIAATGKRDNNIANAETASVEEGIEPPLVMSPVQTKTVQQIVMQQHLVSTQNGIKQMKMDTISSDMITEQMVASTATAPKSAYRKPSPLKSIPVPNPNAAVPNAAAAAGKSSSNTISSILPSASGNVENIQSNTNKKDGLSNVEKLSTAFNDVKYKIQGVQFAAGLTAGINGTFFGPNNFKGFQFGVTGNFILDEKWSIMGEVKYFNRSNSNYAMTDKYVDYTKNDSIVNTFSFSTLHSFELPVSLRYAVGKFNFFAGANFVYALGISTGPDPVATTLVNAPTPGQKSEPVLSSTNFDSRFAIGYLFGMTIQVAPNLTLDLRSAQSVWDNNHTAGGKIVSDQLYKSPSLQFSVGYSFGKKSKTTE